jgi:RecA-family ATPase
LTLKPRDLNDDLLGPILRRNSRVGIAGFVGEGKTSLMLQMVAASAYGEQFFRHVGRGGDTRWLILDLEQGESEIARRLEETGIKDRNGNVCYAHMPDGLRIDQDPEDLEALTELLSQGWDGVALDPAYALLSSEPETEAAARAFAVTLDRFHREHNFCLLIPMHTRKPQEKRTLTLADIYGWSTISRNMQVVLGIQIWDPWVSRWTILKDRTGDVGPKGASQLIGYDHVRLFHPLDDALPGQTAIADAA